MVCTFSFEERKKRTMWWFGNQFRFSALMIDKAHLLILVTWKLEVWLKSQINSSSKFYPFIYSLVNGISKCLLSEDLNYSLYDFKLAVISMPILLHVLSTLHVNLMCAKEIEWHTRTYGTCRLQDPTDFTTHANLKSFDGLLMHRPRIASFRVHIQRDTYAPYFVCVVRLILSQLAWFSWSTRSFIGSDQNSTHPLLWRGG